MPGLCHLTAEDTARKTILQHKGHELFAEYLNFLWSQISGTYSDSKEQSLDQNLDAMKISEQSSSGEIETCLITLCGVLLNLVVLEMDLVMSHTMFTELLGFTVSNLPILGKTI